VSEPVPPVQPNGNLVGAASRLGQSLIAALPPAFLMLMLMNTVFLAMVMWFINHQADERSQMASKLIDRCMEIALQAQPLPRPQADHD
jgi:hypothetical protein